MLTPSATAPPIPAIMFTAANPGPEGSNTTVTLADAPGNTGDRLGTGLVQVQEAVAVTPGLTPKPVAKQAVTDPRPILAADGKTVLFVLVPRASAITAEVTITERSVRRLAGALLADG
jgi:hypothetical protein